jgi:hypothetical protein
MSPAMPRAAATAFVIPHLLYPVARKILPRPRGSFPKKGMRLMDW